MKPFDSRGETAAARPKRLSPQNALHSFAPELLALLERGTLSRQVIPGDTSPTDSGDTSPLEARQLRAIKMLRHMAARLNQIRAALLKSEDPRAPSLYRTKVTVDPDAIVLIVEPRDGDLVSLIARAGINVDVDQSGLDALDAETALTKVSP